MKIKKLLLSFVYLMFISNFTFGQVDLGTASNFALFTVAGAIDNVGPSHFVGDVGTHAGAITGFPPGTLTGQIHEANPTTLQAAADVENAYNYLGGIPCDSVLGNALEGLTLAPMVYCILTAAALNGDLILDGENNPNALFIIKITGVLDVIGIASKIILINSASASNVFWQIDGAVNVGESVIFNGTILANGALSFAQGSELIGHGLSRVGAINTNNMTVTNGVLLPIKLMKFEGKNMHTHNLLTWSTASEVNNDYFTIERTTDGLNYVEIIRINGAGTSSSINKYTYADFDFEKKLNYYRLKQTDYDRASETFNKIAINNFQTSKSIIKVLNILGQEVDLDYTGLRIIYFNNGEILKISGKYVQHQ
jgi:hypothetical protein